ncbi:MAG: glutamine-hydrolyzing GMP synthase, partial [Bacteroidales bacterium]|nr:glutamine-hydrolyzing GMP synthase [Bacteroidales bacterium]
MVEKIIILDFGSQVTQLIGRRLRELNVYCEIHPFNKIPELDDTVKGVILSGSPCSVTAPDAPQVDLQGIKGRLPLLGICYGAQYLAHHYGGAVESAGSREYGRAELEIMQRDPLFDGVPPKSQVWMSHGDTITALPDNSTVLASTASVVNAAYRIFGEQTYAVQFHPEVYHTEYGSRILANFVKTICGCSGSWTPASFIDTTVDELHRKLGNDPVILGLSGGVDSTVAAVLLHKAIGDRLHCIFVDNGLLRRNEFSEVMESYRGMGLNVTGVDAGERFLTALAGLTEPEAKRKAIGKTFIEVFEEEARKVDGARWLAQGTIYPDVIESAAIGGQAAKIKSHHNVGGLPEKMNLQIVEPLRMLFKDEVRRVGRALGIPASLIGRHPFPGPSLAIRVLGEVTFDKLEILRDADKIYIDALRADGLYDKIWQA